MRNKIIGIFICFCVVCMLFTGTCLGVGTFLFSKGPEIMNIISRAPDGGDYTVSKIVLELAYDLVPILWIPETAGGVIRGTPTFGKSTFSKLPRLLNVLGDDTDRVSNVRMVTLDLSNLNYLEFPHGPNRDVPHISVIDYFSAAGNVLPQYEVELGQTITFYVGENVTSIYIWYEPWTRSTWPVAIRDFYDWNLFYDFGHEYNSISRDPFLKFGQYLTRIEINTEGNTYITFDLEPPGIS